MKASRFLGLLVVLTLLITLSQTMVRDSAPGLSAGTTYTYAVSASDAAGTENGQSQGVLGVGESERATDLLECNWDVGTGTSLEVVRGGCFATGGYGTSGCQTEGTCFEVFPGGYGGRNYLQFKIPGQGSTWLSEHTSFNNAEPIYIRYWMRTYSNLQGAVFHPVTIGEIYRSDTNRGIYLERFPGSHVFGFYIESRSFYSDISIFPGQWYRIEYKISSGGTGNGSIEIRIDGVDQTSQHYYYDGNPVYLDDVNGFLDFPENNYFALTTYDRGGGHVGAALDICGLKITDGPNWIGGDDDTTPPTRSNGQPAGTLSSGTTSTTISLDTDETATCKYDTASGVTFDQQQFTFDTTGNTNHSTTVSSLEDGNTYTYYVRCQDEAGNSNTDDFEVSFSVAEPLVLRGIPADQSIHLSWTVSGTLPATSTWQIAYDGPTGDQPSPITDIVSTTRADTLTGLTNYTWYTVTLNATIGSTPFLTDTVRVMPSDIFVYLPLVLKGP